MNYREETASDALRAFAGRVMRDNVSSENLHAYVKQLLNVELIELPAVCRHEARMLSDSHLDMRAPELAALLHHWADQLENRI
ncbi:MAG TPA: hypothetical protein VN541_04065 [Tepidisphaeraceae bacterium]|nr:hypothetical protein [Tepidisphaeraceae bacterium]